MYPIFFYAGKVRWTASSRNFPLHRHLWSETSLDQGAGRPPSGRPDYASQHRAIALFLATGARFGSSQFCRRSFFWNVIQGVSGGLEAEFVGWRMPGLGLGTRRLGLGRGQLRIVACEGWAVSVLEIPYK